MLLLATMGTIAALGLVATLRDDTEKPRTPVPAASAPVNVPRPQPPGAVPPGKVWSPEHGHWHDQPTANPIQIQQTTAPAPATPVSTTPQPQPPGEAPAGKVWSPEHGHWHDAPPK